jgi:ribosomal protein L1
MEVLKDARPKAAKGDFIKNIYISSTMGPGIKISTS